MLLSIESIASEINYEPIIHNLLALLHLSNQLHVFSNDFWGLLHVFSNDFDGLSHVFSNDFGGLPHVFSNDFGGLPHVFSNDLCRRHLHKSLIQS